MFTEQTFTDTQCLEKCMQKHCFPLSLKCCMIVSVVPNLSHSSELIDRISLIVRHVKLYENQLFDLDIFLQHKKRLIHTRTIFYGQGIFFKKMMTDMRCRRFSVAL